MKSAITGLALGFIAFVLIGSFLADQAGIIQLPMLPSSQARRLEAQARLAEAEADIAKSKAETASAEARIAEAARDATQAKWQAMISIVNANVNVLRDLLRVGTGVVWGLIILWGVRLGYIKIRIG